MKCWTKRLIYILGGIIVVFLLVVLAFKINVILDNHEREEAISQTQHYLEENYQDLKFDIKEISSSTDFKHYGYFEHAVTVQNIDTKETFIVFYDKKMNRMEDSINLEKQESFLDSVIKPKIEKYVDEHFGETRFINVSYDIEVGKPTIVVVFNKNHQDITQTDFDTFVMYIQKSVGLDHADVIVYYWTRDLSFNKEF